MSRDDIREALLLLEETEEASAEFRDALLRRFLEEAAPETASAVPERRPPSPRAHRLRVLRPRMAPALAAVVILALLGTLLILVPRPKTAYAVLQQARDRFTRTPFHATMRNVFGEFLGDDTLVVEIWFKSEANWRSTIKSSSKEEPGDFTVFDGKRFGRYEAGANTFFVQPASEIDDPYGHSGVSVHDPTFGEWLTATGLKSTARFLNENCRVSRDRVAGRATDKLSCDTGSEANSIREVDVWLDRETGLILRIVTSEVVREFLSIEYDPKFPAGILEVAAPEGATISGEAAERSVAAPEVDAVIQVGGAVSDIAVGLGAVWVVEWNRSDVPPRPREPGSSPAPQSASAATLKRIDPATNSVVASVSIDSSSGSLAIQGGYVWVATNERGHASSSLLRLDPRTNKFVGSPIPLELGNAQLVVSRDSLWAAYTGHPTLERIDPKSGNVMARITLQGNAFGRPVFGTDSVWVYTQEENPADHYINRIHRVDAATNRIVATIAGKGTLAFGEGALWTLCCATGEERSVTLSRIDPSDNRVTSVELPPGANELAAGAGYVWITDADDRTISKVDPGTLRVVGASIGVGVVPTRLAIGAGAVWVGSYEEGIVARIN